MSAIGVFSHPLVAQAVVRWAVTSIDDDLAEAYDGAGVQGAANECKHGCLVQAVINSADAGSFIYIKMSDNKTTPRAATDYSIRLADGGSMYLPVDDVSKLFAWTDGSNAATMLVVTPFN